MCLSTDKVPPYITLTPENKIAQVIRMQVCVILHFTCRIRFQVQQILIVNTLYMQNSKDMFKKTVFSYQTTSRGLSAPC